MKSFQIRKAALAIALLTPTLLWAQKETLGIVKIKASNAVEAKVAQDGRTQELNQVLGSLNGALTTRFQKAGKFTIVSRDNLQALMTEMAVSGNATLKGGKYILDTTVDGFVDSGVVTRNPPGSAPVISRDIILYGTAVIKMLDSTVFESVTFSVTNHDDYLVPPGGPRAGKFGENLLETAPNEAANQIASYVVSEISSPPEVGAVADKEVTIDWGKGMPVAKGDVWNVYALTGTWTNKDGRVITSKKLVGKVTISFVDTDSSTGDISGTNNGIVAGCVLRKPQ